MKRYLFLVLLFCSSFSFAQVTFSVELGRDTMQIGDINTYRLKLAHPENVTIRSIDLQPITVDPLTKERFYQDTSFTNDPEKMKQLDEYFRQQGFSREVMEVKTYGNWPTPNESMMLTGSEAKWNSQNAAGKVLKENDFQFTFWEEGIHKILPPVIEYEQNGALRTVTANEILIQVGSPLEASSQPVDSLTIAPLKGVIDEPIDIIQDILIPAGLFILGIGLLVGIIYLLTRSKKDDEIEIERPAEYIPANVIALEKLDKLKTEKLWQQGNIKEYQSQLTYIIREYLENRYNINALEQTTFQIGQDLKSLNLSESLQSDLQNILQVADLVKFAKAQPDANVHEQFMTKAEEFVRTTKKTTAQIDAEKVERENAYQAALAEAQKEGFKLARLDYRVYANLIDIPFLLLHIGFLLLFAAMPAMLGYPRSNEMATILFSVLGLIAMLTFFLYEPFLGGSPGKLILGLRVFKENTQQHISIGQSFSRYRLKTREIGMLFSIGSSLVNKKRKLSHDERTRTEVVIKK